ncbi:hypothetical protein K438DRAFT_1107538 [Mycena galopus ATCC 62051]|nr:hypothetical protein K438DRAFT_1107538 [Mycena galopus ATCC 62051]
MASPNRARLPNEITDHIIQNLHSDPKTLANCALVCRSWVPASQCIIFEKLSIRERNCAEIIEHLTSTSPNIASYVKRLYVYLWGDLRTFINRSTEKKTPLLPLFLPHISHFARVTELVLDGCRGFHVFLWDKIWTDVLASAFPSLGLLTVHHLEFGELADLVDLVSSFRQLILLTAADLDITEASHEGWNEDQEPYCGSKTPPLQLGAVNYCSGQGYIAGGGPFLCWLAAGPQALAALSLDLDAEAGDVPAGVELIRAAGDNLRTLCIGFDDQWHLWDGFELSANSSLRSIKFSKVTDFGKSLLGILRSLVSPLAYLTLGDIQHPRVDWPSLIDVLMSPTFASLVRVNLVTSTSSQKHVEELRDLISSKYPDFFAARGVAVFPPHDANGNGYEHFAEYEFGLDVQVRRAGLC